MSAEDTTGTICMKEKLKDDKEYSCACKACTALEKK